MINESGVESSDVESGSSSSGPYGGVIHSFAVYYGSLSGSEYKSLFLEGSPPSFPYPRNYSITQTETLRSGGRDITFQSGMGKGFKQSGMSLKKEEGGRMMPAQTLERLEQTKRTYWRSTHRYGYIEFT